MKKSITLGVLLGIVLLSLNAPLMAQEISNPSTKPKTEKKMQQVLIGKLIVPVNAKEAFIEKLNDNRNILKLQSGYVKDEVYEGSDGNGNLVFISVAVWENIESLRKAKEAVDLEYKKTGFNIVEFCQKLNIKMEQGFYQILGN